MAVGGSLIAFASLLGSGWFAALSVEVVTALATLGYYWLGGRDSDLGAMFGSRADERQASIELRAPSEYRTASDGVGGQRDVRRRDRRLRDRDCTWRCDLAVRTLHRGRGGVVPRGLRALPRQSMILGRRLSTSDHM
jgi:hypothetical protein